MVKQLDSGPNRALFEFKVYGFRHSVVLSWIYLEKQRNHHNCRQTTNKSGCEESTRK